VGGGIIVHYFQRLIRAHGYHMRLIQASFLSNDYRLRRWIEGSIAQSIRDKNDRIL